MGLFFNRKNKKKNTNDSLTITMSDGSKKTVEEANQYWEEQRRKNLILDEYYGPLNMMSGLRKTNPTVGQLKNYFKYTGQNLVGLEAALPIWKEEDNIPRNIPARDEGIDMLMRVYCFNMASKFNKYFEFLGLDEYKSLETVEDVENRIQECKDTSDEVVKYLKDNEVAMLKTLKKELNHLDKEALQWVLNRSYFVTKIDYEKDKIVKLNEKYILKESDLGFSLELVEI